MIFCLKNEVYEESIDQEISKSNGCLYFDTRVFASEFYV